MDGAFRWWTAFAGLVGAVSVAAACSSGGSTGSDVREEEPGEIFTAEDHQAAFDELLRDLHLEVSLRGGWFAKVSIWSDNRSVVASWWGNQAPILDVGYSKSGPGQAWQCQPQSQANGRFPPDSSHCNFLTLKCSCTDDGRRCDCAAELPEVPDNLYVFPSTEMANGGGQEGWNVSGAGIVIPLKNAAAAVVKFVEFEIPETYVLCGGDSATFSWVSAEGLDILLAKQFTSEVVLYREKTFGYQGAPTYDYSQDFCYQESVPNPGNGLFAYDLSFQSLKPCGTEDKLVFRPTAYRDYPTEGRFAKGSFVHAGMASPGFPIQPDPGCGPGVYPPWPGMSGPTALELTYPGGGPFKPPQYFSGGRLELPAPVEGGFFVQWVSHKNDYTDWARYQEDSGTFRDVQDTPGAIRQAVDGTWVGVSRLEPKVGRKQADDSWLLTDEVYTQNPQPTPGPDAHIEEVVETGGLVVGLFSNYKEGVVHVVSLLGKHPLPKDTLCPDGGAPLSLTKANMQLYAVEPAGGEPEPAAPSVRIRATCMKDDDAFALYDTVVDLESGSSETSTALDWQKLPSEYWKSDLGTQPHYLDDDLVVWLALTLTGELSCRVYRAEPSLPAEGLVLESAVPCAEPSPHPEVNRFGDELFVAWPNASSGPPSDAGNARQPVVAAFSLLPGNEPQVGSAPAPPVRPEHVRAARDKSGKLHVFAVGAGLETYWYKEE